MMPVIPAHTRIMNRRLAARSSRPKVTKKWRNWFAACWNTWLKSNATRSAAIVATPSGARATKAKSTGRLTANIRPVAVIGRKNRTKSGTRKSSCSATSGRR